MRSPLVALSTAVLVVVAATALYTGADPESRAAEGEADSASSFDATVTSFDGTSLAVTVYRPSGAIASDPVPVILHSHGWSGTRIADGTGLPGKLWAAGFGVVTIDARGHGDSGGFATVHHKDAEVKDFLAILDWIHDDLDWVQKEPASGIPKDIVAGGAGYSYAGGFQLQTASYDKRLDALAPEITWNDLRDALAPQGAPKSVWIDFLYGTAKQSGTRLDPRIDDWYRDILLTNEVPQDALAHFEGSSPIPSAIEADVVLIQGIPDTLFNLNHALRNYDALEKGAAGDVRLFTHLTGHVGPFVQPFGTTPDRRNIFLDDGPCGVISDNVVRWMDEKLRAGPASGIPEVSYALDNGECVTLDALPTAELAASWPLSPAPNAAGSILLPLVSGDLVFAGAPHLRAKVTSAVEGRAYAGLVIVSADGFTRVVDDQTQPIRILPGQTIDLDLVAIAARMTTNEQLFLRIDGLNEWHAHNGARLPAAALLADITLTVPVVG